MKQKRERHTPLNPPSMGEEVEQFPSRGGVAAFAAGRVPFIRHPEPSFFEGVRISSDTEGVILRLRIQKPWGSHLFDSFFINTLKDEIATSHRTLLAMTEWVDEIATSHRTLLAMTVWADEIATSHRTLLAMTEWVDEVATSHRTLLAMTEQE